MPPLSPNSGLAGNASLGMSTPQSIKNPKWSRISQVANGFLIEMQNEEDYRQTNNVALDFDSAVEIARAYFN